jgi:hypothetical protein
MRRFPHGAPSTASCIVSAGAVRRPVTWRGPAPCPQFGGEHACAGRGQDLVKRERTCSECMSGKEIVNREGMNDGRADVYLCWG